jgi:hypothetical protein
MSFFSNFEHFLGLEEVWPQFKIMFQENFNF